MGECGKKTANGIAIILARQKTFHALKKV